MPYVRVATFNSRLEAETIGHALDQFGIPFLVQGEDVGMFGMGEGMAVPGGVSLSVPGECLAQVRTLLSCVVERPETEAE